MTLPNTTSTVLNPVCSIHGQAYHNGRCCLCDEMEGITTVQTPMTYSAGFELQPPQTTAEKENEK